MIKSCPYSVLRQQDAIEMYITSFIHREELLRIAERWLCGRPAPSDAMLLTRIFICDGYVLGETLETVTAEIVGKFYSGGLRNVRIRTKGELREALSQNIGRVSPRMEYLLDRYRQNPEYFYYQTPINGVLCVDDGGRLIGSYRIKRPKRIAEKANRRIANWIFETVQAKATAMAQARAKRSGIPIERLITPREEMDREFIEAEGSIAESFREGAIRFDRSSITIDDVGGIKVLGTEEQLTGIEQALRSDPSICVGARESFYGSYEATSLVLDIPWDPEEVCRKYRDSKSWEKYVNRGISASELKKGIESFMESSEARIKIELILSTPEAMVESELGNSIHEERIILQRDVKPYKGYIPMNVEFLLEYLFAVGFSPAAEISDIPIKLWGRYLPDALAMHVRRLYQLPQDDLFC
ncbi:MAG: hypothetical protein ABSG91_10830 [Syntrophobacteraceae bacterium]|jgi:hypothetical protein